jgi:hypothetical protein
LILTFDFTHEFTFENTWRNLTTQGKVTLPKNVYIRDATGNLISLAGVNVSIGGFDTETPLLMRGDQIIIDYGYFFQNQGKEIYVGTFNKTTGTHLFSGWISKVTSKKPIEFLIEDNMWQLKQIQAPVRTFLATDTLESIIGVLLQDTGFTVNALTATTIGAFRTGNETVAQVLERIRKQFGLESYFRGMELRCGSTIYIESEAVTNTFIFQHTIISDELEYSRKDDLVLSIDASNKIEEETGETTKDGNPKTKCTRLEVLVTLQNGSNEPIFNVKQKGIDFPANNGGERRTMTYPNAKTIQDLITAATAELTKYYYTGFRGKFTTFGIPYVKHGDNAVLIDDILPERNGTYKVKGVEYTGGVNGLRQVIELDYKLP